MSAEDELQKTGNKKWDSKAAKQLAKKQKEEIFATMGIVGFGKDAKDLGVPAGSKLQAPVWDETTLVPFERNFYQEWPSVAERDAKPYRDAKEIMVSWKYPVPNPVVLFDEAAFPPAISQALSLAGHTEPTPIQAQAWPIALSGCDMIGLAETGSGKTLAYMLPAIVHVSAQPELRGEDGPLALVLCPTRELACQIQVEADKFGERAGVLSSCLYGGVDKAPQKRQLQRGSHLCIACPGRLIDFLETGTTNLNRITFFVLDEADRMMDMGFDKQVCDASGAPLYNLLVPLRVARKGHGESQNVAVEFLVFTVKATRVVQYSTPSSHDRCPLSSSHRCAKSSSWCARIVKP